MLAGYRVLDLTNVLAGPFCGHQLAHLGAEVIKVERPGGGDLARSLGRDPSLNAAGMGVSFLAQNAGKLSITLDLKQAAGREVLERLVKTADVLVENFRPGVMEKLGVGYQRLSSINPELVYCAISGFGQTGPLARQPAYDQIVQGMAGVMDITGNESSGPLRVGYPMADTIGGLTAAFAIAAALARRTSAASNASPALDKSEAGAHRGCFIDVSMLESVLATMGWAVSDYLVAGATPARRGNDNVTASPSGAFITGDGLLNIAANRQTQFESLCAVIGRVDLVSDPRFATRDARLEHRDELAELVEQALERDSAVNWAARLNEASVPAGIVASVPDALGSAQIAERGIVAEFENVPGVGRDVRLLRTGVKVDGQAPSVKAPPPRLGEHTTKILDALGYSESEVARLVEDGTVTCLSSTTG